MSIRSDENAAVLRLFEKNNQCHSDIGDPLLRAGLGLPGVRCDASHGKKPFPAIALIEQGNVFAVAQGMRIILRLSPSDAETLVLAKGEFETEIGYPGWISASLYPHEFDLPGLVQKAFEYSSE